MNDVNEDSPPHGAEVLRLWAGFLLPPFAWMVDLGVSYALAGKQCERGGLATMLAVTIVALVTVGAGALLTMKSRRRIDEGGKDGSVEHGRTKLFVIGGFANALFFAIVIIAMAMPKFLLGSCP